MSNSPEQPEERSSWQPRFGIGSLLLVSFVFCVMGAAGFYLLRALQYGRAAQLAFILFTLAAPSLMVVIASLLRSVFSRRRG
jgi:hypothetical protein